MRIGAMLGIILFSAGCVHDVSREEMLAEVHRLEFTSLPDVYYTGSDARYDWFRSFGATYRVPTGELAIDPRMPRTDEPEAWRLLRADGSVQPPANAGGREMILPRP